MLKDDILGGVSIWPRFITQDYYVWTQEWDDISEEVEEGLYSSLSPALAKQFDSFEPGINELVILCRKKRK